MPTKTTVTPTATLSQMYYVVLPLVRRAGQMLQSRQASLRDLDDKARHERRHEIETEIRQLFITTLGDLFPDHGVLGATSKKTDWQWVLTPIDGVQYYQRGLPLYATAVALRHKGEVVLGVVYQPTTNDLFHALKGEGAFLGERQLAVSTQKTWNGATAYVQTVDHSDKPASPAARQKVAKGLVKEGANVVDLGVPMLGLCYVAAGVYDLVLAPIASGSIIAYTAGLLIAREAGAKLSDADGKALGGGKATSFLVAAPGVHKKALTVGT